jgi:hypothetical protein
VPENLYLKDTGVFQKSKNVEGEDLVGEWNAQGMRPPSSPTTAPRRGLARELSADRQAAFAHGQAFTTSISFKSLFTPALTGAEKPLLLFIDRVA